MRTRFSWVILLSLIALINLGCGIFDNGDDDPENPSWTSPFVEKVVMGTVAIQPGETANVPLSYSYSIRFELSKAVTEASLSQLFDYEIWVENLTRGRAWLLTPASLDANGELVWTTTDNKTIEFRSYHPLSQIASGNSLEEIGQPGDNLRVRVQFVLAQTIDGNQIAVLNDTFYIVWTS